MKMDFYRLTGAFSILAKPGPVIASNVFVSRFWASMWRSTAYWLLSTICFRTTLTVCRFELTATAITTLKCTTKQTMKKNDNYINYYSYGYTSTILTCIQHLWQACIRQVHSTDRWMHTPPHQNYHNHILHHPLLSGCHRMQRYLKGNEKIVIVCLQQYN